MSRFQNRAFCVNAAEGIPVIGPLVGSLIGTFFPTDVYYQPNYIEGRKNGSVSTTHVTQKSGGCSQLLMERFRQSYY